MELHPTADGQAEFLDIGEAITEYRQALANRDSARCETERDVFQQQADSVRTQWAKFNGDDDLSELAIGDNEAL